MNPSFDPKKLFPMPNEQGASFEDRGDPQTSSTKLIGQQRFLPKKGPAGLSAFSRRSRRR